MYLTNILHLEIKLKNKIIFECAVVDDITLQFCNISRKDIAFLRAEMKRFREWCNKNFISLGNSEVETFTEIAKQGLSIRFTIIKENKWQELQKKNYKRS